MAVPEGLNVSPVPFKKSSLLMINISDFSLVSEYTKTFFLRCPLQREIPYKRSADDFACRHDTIILDHSPCLASNRNVHSEHSRCCSRLFCRLQADFLHAIYRQCYRE
jgi:hypothetical protein